MTRQNSLKSKERELFDEGVTRTSGSNTGSVVLNLALGLGKLAARKAYRAAYTQMTGEEPEQNGAYRTARKALDLASYVKTRTEGGEDFGSVLVNFGKEYASSKIDGAKRKIRGYVPEFADNKVFENYVKGFLNGKTYGAEIEEASIDVFLNDEYTDRGKTRRGSTGMWGYENGRKVVRIQKTEDVGTLIGKELSEADARAVQTYLKGHEVLEANPMTGPKSQADHAAFEAKYLSALQRLAQTNQRAEEVYRGARIMYRQRQKNNNDFFHEVAEHMPNLRQEVRAVAA